MGWPLVVGVAASYGLQALGHRKAGKQARRIAAMNAGFLRLQAEDALRRGRELETRYRTAIRGLIGAQRAAFAGQGVEIGYGSALDVEVDTRAIGEADALTIRNNAAREAWGFRTQARLVEAGGQVAAQVSTLNAISSLVEGTTLAYRLFGDGGGSLGGGSISESFPGAYAQVGM